MSQQALVPQPARTTRTPLQSTQGLYTPISTLQCALGTTTHRLFQDQEQTEEEPASRRGVVVVSKKLPSSKQILHLKHNRKRRRKDASYQNDNTKRIPPCVPCAYKIGCYDFSFRSKDTNAEISQGKPMSSLVSSFVRQIPNRRPEECPRDERNRNFKQTKQDSHFARRETLQRLPQPPCYAYGYRRGMNILCLGDGDLSFSLALARMLLAPTDSGLKKTVVDCVNSTRIVATSYESLETLQRIYGKKHVNNVLKELRGYGSQVQVLYQVDATDLHRTLHAAAKTSGSDEDKKEKNIGLLPERFHRVVWNFPCTILMTTNETNDTSSKTASPELTARTEKPLLPPGQDGQKHQLHENTSMLHYFLTTQAPALLHPKDGEIMIAHKTRPPFDRWKVEEQCGSHHDDEADTAKQQPRLECKGRLVLDKSCFPPYQPQKAMEKKSFPCHDARVYVFGWARMHSVEDKHKNKHKKKVMESEESRMYQVEESFPPTIPADVPADEVSVLEDSRTEYDAKLPPEDENLSTKTLALSLLMPVTQTMLEQICQVHLDSHKALRRDKKQLDYETGTGNKRKKSASPKKEKTSVKQKHRNNKKKKAGKEGNKMVARS